ncbi:MAG: dTDP-4-dehydrorhamnose 3,5-epimerase [Azoarcus sp.]|jgi:dTDP-4-dehydrorhamnose 3,5-epimerase|nr:dTDP-4-dehydrorhamnose 3,5-epimerase [Azoarcus sp.]
MEVIPTALPGVLILEQKRFDDSRGFFVESYNERDFQKATGLTVAFTQDNHSRSAAGVVRGMHYKIKNPEGKLVRVVCGRVLDIAVDMRKGSPHFGRWVGIELSEDAPHRMVWVPPGFAHGFAALSERVDFLYKTSGFYEPHYERTLLWNDPEVGIELPPEFTANPILSDKDRAGTPLKDAEPCVV